MSNSHVCVFALLTVPYKSQTQSNILPYPPLIINNIKAIKHQPSTVEGFDITSTVRRILNNPRPRLNAVFHKPEAIMVLTYCKRCHLHHLLGRCPHLPPGVRCDDPNCRTPAELHQENLEWDKHEQRENIKEWVREVGKQEKLQRLGDKLDRIEQDLERNGEDLEEELRESEARERKEKLLRIGDKLNKIAGDLERNREGLEDDLRESKKKEGKRDKRGGRGKIGSGKRAVPTMSGRMRIDCKEVGCGGGLE